MDVFEYLPQLIVAYDGNDEFANLIHVKKASKDEEYYCPCCGGIVKPRVLDSDMEQSHYYHKTGKCTKESQLHFFCKNWLFETGSKFYIEDTLFEVSSVEIEQEHYTTFGSYKPDVTVYTTTGKEIYFEMFFTNRKTGDDYFCKWDELGNDVVEINIKEYMVKTEVSTIPSFKYLYHDGVCYDKKYLKRDLYATTIARVKKELIRQKNLNYKVRIEQLDSFWKEVRKKTKEDILKSVSAMEYEDMVFCYEIIKKKYCVSYLKDDVLNMINEKVVSSVREYLNLPKVQGIYFDLRHVHGRTYEAGIRLNLKTEHITYDKLFVFCDNHLYNFDGLKAFPKIVFNKNVFSTNEIIISDTNISELKDIFSYVVNYREKLLKYENELHVLEKDTYVIRMRNDLYTVLVKNNNKLDMLFEDFHIDSLDIKMLEKEINNATSDNENKLFLEKLFISNEYLSFVAFTEKYKSIDVQIDIKRYIKNKKNSIKFKMYICNKQVFDKKLETNMEDFLNKKIKCELIIQDFVKTYETLLKLVEKINDCANKIWKVNFLFDCNGYPTVEIDQKLFKPMKYLTWEKICFERIHELNEEDIVNALEIGMQRVLKNMEKCGYRVMEVNKE